MRSATSLKLSRRISQLSLFPASLLPFCAGVPAIGVGQPLCCEVQSLSDVRRADARSAEIDRFEGVTLSFHVSVYKVEPSKAVLARNLLAKNNGGVCLGDEVVEERP